MLRRLTLWFIAAVVLLAQQQQTDLATVRQWIDSGRFIRVRELGESMLRQNKNSPMGNYLLGVAMQRGEGNLPLAR